MRNPFVTLAVITAVALSSVFHISFAAAPIAQPAYQLSTSDLVAIAKIMAKADEIAKQDGGRIYSIMSQNIVSLRAKYAGKERQTALIEVISKQVASRLARPSGSGAPQAVAKPAAAAVAQQTQEQIQKVNDVVGSGVAPTTPKTASEVDGVQKQLQAGGLTPLESNIYTSGYGPDNGYDFVACAPFTRDVYPKLYCVNASSTVDQCDVNEANIVRAFVGGINPTPARGASDSVIQNWTAVDNGLLFIRYCAGGFHKLEKKYGQDVTQDVMVSLFAKLGRTYYPQRKPFWEIGVKYEDAKSWAAGLGNGLSVK